VRDIQDPDVRGGLLLASVQVTTDTRLARAVRQVLGAAGRVPATDEQLTAVADVLRISRDRWRAFMKAAEHRAAELQDAATRADAVFLPYWDPAYPSWLWEIPDPPLALWVRGDPTVLGRPLVALVGSRAATPAGLMVARRLSAALAEAGLGVVSGLARGVDGAAHEGALEAGQTAAVLGCGVDIVYPRHHGPLARRIVASGAIVSELPVGAPPLARHFPLRNRIISGLARAVVVVEASERSGSLITARQALEQGRDVLAVPGGVLSGRYRGCHALIKDGARLVETVEDILDEVGWTRPRETGEPSSAAGREPASTPLERLWPVGEAADAEDLARQSGCPVPHVLARLLELELAGRVARIPGGRFVRLDGPAKDRR